MSIMRVTQGLMVTRALSNLNYQTRRLLELQEQLATGLRVNAPSDDPLAARTAIDIRQTMSRSQQYLDNISGADLQLLESVTAIQSVVDVLQRANEIALQGSNGTMDQQQRNQLAVEANQLLESVLMEANHQTNGRYVFGGTRTLSAPYVPARNAQGEITSVAYAGNLDQISVGVADGVSVVVNETGQNAFQSTQDVMQLLIDIRDNLRTSDLPALQQRLAELKRGQDQALASVARIGATQNRLERLTTNTEDHMQQLQVALSNAIEADYAETVMNLNAQTNAFQAALSASARVIQQSLLDYVS
ncbi:MAG: flagellar hook-associated protein FlgL [Candidatus Hydrogenedentes bacterium]|nr:flagellar hook-associated protein FlgL [Candidatus Hydrogenedentota bacterium]